MINSVHFTSSLKYPVHKSWAQELEIDCQFVVCCCDKQLPSSSGNGHHDLVSNIMRLHATSSGSVSYSMLTPITWQSIGGELGLDVARADYAHQDPSGRQLNSKWVKVSLQGMLGGWVCEVQKLLLIGHKSYGVICSHDDRNGRPIFPCRLLTTTMCPPPCSSMCGRRPTAFYEYIIQEVANIVYPHL